MENAAYILANMERVHKGQKINENRNKIRWFIMNMLISYKSSKGPITPEINNDIAKRTEQFEEYLYNKSSSINEYSDISTLGQRMIAMIQDKKSSS